MRTCECGCGEAPPLAPHSSKRNGWTAGKPIRFVHGHNMRLRRRGLDYVVNERGCWVWQHGKDKNGYGQVAGGPSKLAHRVYFEQRHGYLPATLHHRCENPSCVNPDHLEPCRRSDNVRISKRAKLTYEQVREIKSRPGEMGTVLAQQYGVHKATIYGIRAGRVWADVS